MKQKDTTKTYKYNKCSNFRPTSRCQKQVVPNGTVIIMVYGKAGSSQGPFPDDRRAIPNRYFERKWCPKMTFWEISKIELVITNRTLESNISKFNDTISPGEVVENVLKTDPQIHDF